MINFLKQVFIPSVFLTQPAQRNFHSQKKMSGAFKAIFLVFCLTYPTVLKAQDTSAIKPIKSIIVSWNIQMLPNTFAMFSNSLRKKQRVRTPWIIEYCHDQNYDVIVFQEVFDSGIKRKFKKYLSSTYPFQVDTKKKVVVFRAMVF